MAWLETADRYEKGVDGESAENFMKTIGCFVMGSQTYELALALGWPYGDVPTFVLTRRRLEAARPSVECLTGDVTQLFDDVLEPRYENIWLVDDLRVSVVPVLLGERTPFVEQVGGDRPLHLKEVTPYKNGIVELWYGLRQ